MILQFLLVSWAAAHDVACPPSPTYRPADKVRRAGTKGLTNPLLDVEPSIDDRELRPFQHKVEALIAKHKGSGAAKHVSVYYRDLNNGPLFGVDSNEKFQPASLLKVPVMIAALKRGEKEPSFLQLRAKYEPERYALAATAPPTLKSGGVYDVDELLWAMIADSDNPAAHILRTMTGDPTLSEVYRDLGLLIPDVRTPEDYMTVREYGTFFRILYNASYLSRTNSEKALLILSKSSFKKGLPAGVPRGTVVAHKFGEREYKDKKGRQLHDCGIVYAPNRPYILCIMTRGEDFQSLTTVIRDISEVVYKEVTSS